LNHDDTTGTTKYKEMQEPQIHVDERRSFFIGVYLRSSAVPLVFVVIAVSSWFNSL